ncbi:hypothetical protein NKR23_g3920 [Pleurostoma richardsiae]|jgi:hypothetical protein|uniref:Myb-like domain-containing protein n=1 Tax=Pleurostoma richardsiae TaxID=41990 RepID=A0AA38VGD0_9PEZI|nr:hypothetical protein NKR23_g3920 [Pleurostoma richardsiae]
MAPAKNTKKTDSDGASASSTTVKTLSEGEMKFFKAMMENMQSKPDVDWDNVAVCLGLKDSKCARERFRQISVKFGWNEKAGAAPTTPAGRKSGVTTIAAHAGPSTPTKITKRTGKVGTGRGRKRVPTKATAGADLDEFGKDAGQQACPGQTQVEEDVLMVAGRDGKI